MLMFLKYIDSIAAVEGDLIIMRYVWRFTAFKLDQSHSFAVTPLTWLWLLFF